MLFIHHSKTVFFSFHSPKSIKMMNILRTLKILLNKGIKNDAGVFFNLLTNIQQNVFMSF